MKEKDGILRKMNPALRTKEMQEETFEAVLSNRIDCIGTDHAPHTLEDKTKKYMSGIPGFPYYPQFIKLLRSKGLSEEIIENITHKNIVKIFNLDKDLIPNTKRAGKQSKEEIEELVKEYPYDSFPNYLF